MQTLSQPARGSQHPAADVQPIRAPEQLQPISRAAMTAASPKVGLTTELGKAAGWYARALGWHVFPIHGVRDGRCTCGNPACGSPGKHPRTPHGVKDATSGAQQIESWWSQRPDSSIGLATGEPSGVDVLDVDPRACGDESLYELERKHGELGPTVISLTGGGGSHLFFRHITGLKNQAGEIGAGLDFKTSGGYVILPPSSHASGRAYAWKGGSRPNERAVSEAPAWLAQLLSTVTRPLSSSAATRAGARRAADGEKWAPGERNNRLTSIAGAMRRRGLSQEAIEAALLAENRLRCEPLLEEAEVQRIAASVALYQPDSSERSGFRVEDIPAIWTLEASTRWLIEDLVPQTAITLLIGDSGVGKSTFVLALAAAVARGERFLGEPVERRPVLYVDRENPLAVVKERLARMRIVPTPELHIWGGWVDPSPSGPEAAAILLGSGAFRPPQRPPNAVLTGAGCGL